MTTLAASRVVLAAGEVRRPVPGRSIALLAAVLVAVIVLACAIGAVAIAPDHVLASLARRLGLDLGAVTAREDAILWSIRLPRVLLAVVVGAGLGAAGAAMQGVARNPLADPGIVGVSTGAALAAVAFLVVGGPVVAAWPAGAPWMLPAAAFLGGLVTTFLALALAQVDGRTSAVSLLLGGVALAALSGAGIGVLIYAASDAQLRTITFWSLGSLGGATWPVVAAVAVPVGAAVIALPRLACDLDRLLLGEAEARHLGVEVERVTRRVVVLVALAVGAGVAACGVIGFVGLVVPHLIRGWLGPSHRTLILASALGGAALLVGADVIARVVVAPTELPIGVVTALIGAPMLLWLIRRGEART